MRGRWSVVLTWVLALPGLVALAPALAGAELVLEDGQVLSGTSVERRGDLFHLELASGGVLPIPVELVLELRLTGEEPAESESDPDEVPAQPAPTAEGAEDEPASGMRRSEPRTLAGRPGGAELRKPHEQLAVLGPPARFRRGVFDPVWRPSSDWGGPATDVTQFNPARWYRPPIDPRWQPSSDYTRGSDVTQFNPVHWYRPPISSTWWPTDGFRREDD
jgi:hypothetical protein